MNEKYLLSCESTADLPFSHVDGRGVSVLFYTYVIDGTEYVDDMERTPGALDAFYEKLEQGALPSTSQINVYRYEEYFRELLRQGDVLHISFGSGMTPSVRNASEAAEHLREEFPDRKLIVVDSLCSCAGYGLLVDEAADLRDGGASMEEVERFLLEQRRNVHHQFFSTDLTMFRRSGRMSGPTATIATVLGVCPIMHLDADGRIVAYDKVRGKKNAVRKTVETMERHVKGGAEYDGRIYIAHSRCLSDAEETRAALQAKFPKAKEIRIFNIGTIIASHCGPGTVAVFFLGDRRS